MTFDEWYNSDDNNKWHYELISLRRGFKAGQKETIKKVLEILGKHTRGKGKVQIDYYSPDEEIAQRFIEDIKQEFECDE